MSGDRYTVVLKRPRPRDPMPVWTGDVYVNGEKISPLRGIFTSRASALRIAQEIVDFHASGEYETVELTPTEEEK